MSTAFVPLVSALLVALFAEPLQTADDSATNEIVEALRRSAIPLKTVEAGHGFDDLQPLRAIVGDARVVALGEAARAREFFQMKHRMLEFLVAEMGFSVFAIEANGPEALAVEEYVLHGTGDPKIALATALYGSISDTEEMLDLVVWMRKWNEEADHATKVHFAGIDMQFTQVAAEWLQAYMSKVDPEYMPRLSSYLAPFRQTDAQKRPRYTSIAPEDRAAYEAGIDELVAVLKDGAETYGPRSSEEEWLKACHYSTILAQAERMYRARAEGSHEDPHGRFMADNVVWILEHAGPNSKVVVWSNNGQVDRVGEGSMGASLVKTLGDANRVLGFAFGQGSFQAIASVIGRDMPEVVREITVGPLPAGTLESTLSQVGVPLAVFDLHALGEANEVTARWWSASHSMRVFRRVAMNEPDAVSDVVPARSFDALIWVERTTPIRSLHSSKTFGK